MQTAELAGPATAFSPGLDELSILAEFHDAPIRTLALIVAVRDENIAVGRHDHVGRRSKNIRALARFSRLAEPHKDFALRAELSHLHSTLLVLRYRFIGHPHVTIAIDKKAVWTHDQACTEFPQGLARRIEFDNRIQV